MAYTKGQKKLVEALDAMHEATQEKWPAVVDAVNEYREAILDGDEFYDACFPPEIQDKFDAGALNTAWIYSRIEVKSRRDTKKKIRRALGFTYP